MRLFRSHSSYTETVVALLLAAACGMTPGYASAQLTQGVQYFNNNTVSAFASTSNLFISVFAQRSQGSSGTSGFAVVNVFDSSTGAFSQCVNAEFDLSISMARTTLSFITEGGPIDCSSGQPIALACEPTSESGVFHNVTNGTAKLGAFDQQFTTHGLVDHYTNMSCVLTAFGAQFAASGEAFSEQLTTTP